MLFSLVAEAFFFITVKTTEEKAGKKKKKGSLIKTTAPHTGGLFRYPMMQRGSTKIAHVHVYHTFGTWYMVHFLEVRCTTTT